MLAVWNMLIYLYNIFYRILLTQLERHLWKAAIRCEFFWTIRCINIQEIKKLVMFYALFFSITIYANLNFIAVKNQGLRQKVRSIGARKNRRRWAVWRVQIALTWISSCNDAIFANRGFKLINKHIDDQYAYRCT